MVGQFGTGSPFPSPVQTMVIGDAFSFDTFLTGQLIEYYNRKFRVQLI